LEDRVKSPSGSSETISDDGRAAWEATPAQREASLKERKAQMIIAARQYVVLTPFLEFALIIMIHIFQTIISAEAGTEY
jgi:hypothetical protein